MVDATAIDDIFRNLDTYVKLLRGLAQIPKEEVVRDPVRLGAAKYYLHIAIEACIDVANHLIARQGLRAPETYADSFTVLAENGIIDEEFASKARMMARMRNRLVHLYWEVNANLVYDILQDNLDDFEVYQQQITTYLRGREASR